MSTYILHLHDDKAPPSARAHNRSCYYQTGKCGLSWCLDRILNSKKAAFLSQLQGPLSFIGDSVNSLGTLARLFAPMHESLWLWPVHSSFATFLSFTAVTKLLKPKQNACTAYWQKYSANQVSYINELLILNRIIESKLSRFPAGICGSCSGILSVFAVGGFHRIPNTPVDFRFLQILLNQNAACQCCLYSITGGIT